MQLFFSNNIQDNFAWFDEVEARHCVQVLRKQVGDVIHFVDGEGGWYEGQIDEVGKKKLVAKIISSKQAFGKLPYHLHVAIAPTKNIDRFEWFLEKATEIGISEITPLLCEHSERKRIRPERLEKILHSAMKQSLKAFLPKLNQLADFQYFMDNFETEAISQRFIAHCQGGELPHLKNNCRPGGNVTILIGPEGDFSPPEIQLAKRLDWQEISLGNSRLRTETAGIAATHIVNLVN